jgi:hypothetical protein
MLTRTIATIRRKFEKNDSDRAIFRYLNGNAKVGIDPVVALRMLKEDPALLVDEHPRAAIKGDDEAIRICVSATRNVFGLKPFSQINGRDCGTTDAEALATLIQFGQYLDTLKKNSNGPPISPPLAVPTASENSTTNSASASGSTVAESPTAMPMS